VATAPSPEDTARAILQTLVTRLNVRGGQGALRDAVIQNARSQGVDPEDFEAGLTFAIAQGWILSVPSKHWVGLTDAGFATACLRAASLR